jgi:hypothetical protein
VTIRGETGKLIINRCINTGRRDLSLQRVLAPAAVLAVVLGAQAPAAARTRIEIIKKIIKKKGILMPLKKKKMNMYESIERKKD